MNKETIIINNLTKQFKETLAVKNISFKINKGKIMSAFLDPMDVESLLL